MKLRKKIISMFGIFATLGATIIPAVACSNSSTHDESNLEGENSNPNNNNLNPDGNNIGDNNDVPGNNGPSEDYLDKFEGRIDEKVIAASLVTKNIKFNPIESNSFGLLMDRNEFISTFDPIDKLTDISIVNTERFKYDVYSYIDDIFKSSNKKVILSITKEDLNLSIENKTIEIDFELKLENPTKYARSFKIGKLDFFIKPFSSRIVKISAPKSQLLYNVKYDSKTQKDYVQWMVETVNISVDDQKDVTTFKNFSFNSINSYAFPVYVNNIFKEKEEYLKEEKFDIKKLSDQKVKEDIKGHFQYTADIVIKYIGFVNPILTSLTKNESLDKFVSDIATPVSEILVKAEFIDESLKPLIVDLLSNKKGIATIINEQADVISNFIVKAINNPSIPVELIKEFVIQISPNMSDEQKQFFYSILTSNFIPENYQTLLINLFDLLIEDKTLFQFVDKILTDFEQQITSLIPQTETIKTIVEFIKFVFSKNIENNSYKNVLDLLLNDKQKVATLIKSVLSLTGINLLSSDLIDQVYTNNDNLNVTTVKKLLDVCLIPLSELATNPQHYQIVSQFEQNNGVDNFGYNVDTNLVTFKYELKVIFKKELKLDLHPIYDILPNNLNIDGTSVPISVILGLKVLPDYFTFGVNDSIDLSFSSEQQPLILKPIDKGNYHVFNYIVPYTIDFRLNMPSGFSSIFEQYWYGFGPLRPVNWSMIESIATAFLFPSYTMSGVLNSTHNDWINYNYVAPTPDINRTFKWNDLTEEQYKSLWNYIETVDSYKYDVKNNAGKTVTLTGKKPKLIESKRQELADMLFSFGSGFDNLPENQKPIISISPTVSGKIQLMGSLGVGLNVGVIEVSIIFPTERVIDLNNSDPIKSNYSYGSVFKKTFSFS